MNPKRTHTMRDIATLKQLHDDGQLTFETEFQRDSVWPDAAKSYLIDTILTDRPIPYLYFRRSISAQSGKSEYQVIDGQQRLRAIFEFLEGRLSLSQSKRRDLKGKKFHQLTQQQRSALLSYDLLIEELSGFTDAEIREIFLRMNKYVVKLSPQEIRNARFKGRFKELTQTIGAYEFWRRNSVFTRLQLRRMRAVEFSGELIILMVEGPQDKKAALDLYYSRYEHSAPFAARIVTRLKRTLAWIEATLPELKRSRYRKPTDLYALIGALEKLSDRGRKLPKFSKHRVGRALDAFERRTRVKEPTGQAARYLVAASQQTDNLAPRLTRIEILADVIKEAK